MAWPFGSVMFVVQFTTASSSAIPHLWRYFRESVQIRWIALAIRPITDYIKGVETNRVTQRNETMKRNQLIETICRNITPEIAQAISLEISEEHHGPSDEETLQFLRAFNEVADRQEFANTRCFS